jgi:hypothetical protein
MNDGKKSYRVKPSKIQESVNNGFVYGRLTSYIDDKYKEKRKLSAIKQWQKIKNANIVKI